MPYTEDQEAEFKEQIRCKRRNQFVLAIPLIAVIVILVMSEGEETVLGMDTAIVGPAAFVIVLAGLAYSLYNWRCPACKKYLGKAINPSFCSKCGVKLS